MKYVEIVCARGCTDSVLALAEQLKLSDCRLGPVADEMQVLRLLVADDKLQPVLDGLQTRLAGHPASRITVLPVEIALPAAPPAEREQENAASAARETLYAEVEKNARLNTNYLVLVLLSTAVAAIGLLKDDVAVVIGAMVIAPLLGPNLAFGLGTALGDIALMRKAALTNLLGIGLVVMLAAGIGALRLFETSSAELLARTEVGLDSAVLALAAGAAAVLSLTTGLSSVLVGVMVAVALLPPAVVLGVMLGGGQWSLAAGAGLLLAVNLVCVNLACNVVFLLKGVFPRSWFEQQRARRATLIYALMWIVTLLVLMLLIYLRQTLLG
uniref:TIGR00341 family protein n=1 Tax=uncultured bacterium UPO36 TaxID=1776963 RepID=A0A126SXM1_9BACT|nr:hypothetical protein Paes_1618 [uncultured bacterium UPO36]